MRSKGKAGIPQGVQEKAPEEESWGGGELIWFTFLRRTLDPSREWDGGGSCEWRKAGLETLSILGRNDSGSQDGKKEVDSGNELNVDLANLADE